MIKHKCSNPNCRPCNDPAYELTTYSTIKLLLKDKPRLSGLFVDCGAHCGLWSLRMHEFYKNTGAAVPEIIAIEPEDVGYRCLEANLDPLEPPDFIAIHHCAAWVTDDAELSFSPHGARTWVRSDSTSGHHKVYGYTVDTLVKEMLSDTPDVMKVDCEGSEAFVLAGAKDTLYRMAADRSVLVVEYCPVHLERHDTTIAGIHKFLSFGFKLTNISEARLLKQRPKSVFNAVYQGLGK